MKKEKKGLVSKILGFGVVSAIGVAAMVSDADAVKKHSPLLSVGNDSWTGIGLQNNNSTNVPVTVTVRNQDGEDVKEVTRNIVPNGHTAFVVSEGLEAGIYSFTIDSEKELASLAFVGRSGYNVGMFQIPTSKARDSLTIPHVATLEGWESRTHIMNTSDNETDILVSAYDDEGELVKTISYRGINPQSSFMIDVKNDIGEYGGSLRMSSSDGKIVSCIVESLESRNWEAGVNAVPTVLEYDDLVQLTDSIYVHFDGDPRVTIQPNEKVIDSSNGETLEGILEVEGDMAIVHNGKRIQLLDYPGVDIDGLNSTYTINYGTSKTVNLEIEDFLGVPTDKVMKVYKDSQLISEQNVVDGAVALRMTAEDIGYQKYVIEIIDYNMDGDILGMTEEDFYVNGWQDNGGPVDPIDPTET